MNIGDRVRLLHGKEEGRIINFKGKNMVEIEIEDGFIIPALKEDVVVVAKDESEYFSEQSVENSDQPDQKSLTERSRKLTGAFLFFLPVNENDLSLNLINLTNKDILFNISENYGSNAKSLGNGKITKDNSVFISYFKLSDFDKWPELLVQLIPVNTSLETTESYVEFKVKFKAPTFFKSKRKVDLINKEGYLIEIAKTAIINADKLKESFFKHRSEKENLIKDKPDRPFELNPVVDLHIENLVDEHQGLSNEDILSLQLKTFEKELDIAISRGCNSIKFVHGIGNGTLRHMIHKELSQSEQIKFFEDSDKGKFGYGATTVHI